MAARHEVTVPMHAVKFLCTSAFHCCLKIATHCCVVVLLCFIGGQPDTIVLFRVFPVPMHMVKCQSHLSLLPQDSICSDLDLAVTVHSWVVIGGRLLAVIMYIMSLPKYNPLLQQQVFSFLLENQQSF